VRARWRLGCLSAVAALVAVGCAGDDRPSSSAVPDIVATTSIWSDVVRNVACDGLATVESLIPVGADPHGYEPSLADRARIESAVLVVANGLGLEESLDDTLDAAEADGASIFRMGDHVSTIELAGAGDEHEGDAGADSEAIDPHIWLDPQRTIEALDDLGAALVAAGLDGDRVGGCIRRYTSALRAVDQEMESILAIVPAERRKLVTNHEALGYLADRYGFEILGAVIPASSTVAEASPGQLAALADEIESAGVPTIFSETQLSDSDAKALAAEIGDVDVVALTTDTLGSPGSQAATYETMLTHNARLIAEGLAR
jgi:zinc/manganese transport system substrate-binding protein